MLQQQQQQVLLPPAATRTRQMKPLQHGMLVWKLRSNRDSTALQVSLHLHFAVSFLAGCALQLLELQSFLQPQGTAVA